MAEISGFAQANRTLFTGSNIGAGAAGAVTTTLPVETAYIAQTTGGTIYALGDSSGTASPNNYAIAVPSDGLPYPITVKGTRVSLYCASAAVLSGGSQNCFVYVH